MQIYIYTFVYVLCNILIMKIMEWIKVETLTRGKENMEILRKLQATNFYVPKGISIPDFIQSRRK